MDLRQAEMHDKNCIAQKEPYEKPKVTTFGSVAKLTLSGGSSFDTDNHSTRHPTHYPGHHHF